MGSETLTLGSRNDLNYNFFDNVSVTGPPAVPEPAPWALMILGAAGLGVALRRRRAMTALSFACP